MLQIIGTTITLTRGDTARIHVPLYQKDGSRYTPKDGDVIRFAAKANYKDDTCLIRKIIPNDTLILQLDPADTKPLDFGAYVYDIEVTFENGDVDTVICKATLNIDKEVD